MNSLEYRRQYLLCPFRCPQLSEWQCVQINSHFLYAHPDCELNIVSDKDGVFALAGYFLMPNKPHLSTKEILAKIKTISPDNIAKFLYSVTGRFVLFVQPTESDNFFVFNDCCGLKTVYYYKLGNKFFISSQPRLIQVATKIEPNDNYYAYINSKYVKTNKTHYPPSGISLFKDVYHLVPNHYFDTRLFKQIRYWPYSKLDSLALTEAVERFSNILENTFSAASNKFSLALAMTAGWDSRLLLSATKSISHKTHYFTFLYRELNTKSPDVLIPKTLLNKLRLQHYIIDAKCDSDPVFKRIYENISHISHYDDWGIIAEGVLHNFPSDRVSVRGGCAEVARYDFPQGYYSNVKSYTDLLANVHLWTELDFVDKHLSTWFNETKNISDDLNYNIRDIFYWEHRLGSWLALNKLEWDIAHEVFVPFNNRELLDIALSVDPKYRHGPDFVFFRNVILKLWPEVLDIPINPVSKADSFKRRVFEKAKLVLGVNTFNSVKKYLKKQ